MVQFTDFQLLVLEKQNVECDDAVELMAEVYEELLPATLNGRIHAHISDCEECNHFYSEFSRSMQLVANEDEIPVPLGVQNRLRKALNERLGLSLPAVTE